MDFLMIYFQDC